MRFIMVAGVLAAALSGSPAFAQHVHHNFCLKTGSAQECAYDSFAQCEAAKRGNADSACRTAHRKIIKWTTRRPIATALFR